MGRPLKKDKDFERSLGEEVEIRLYRAVDSQKEYAGVLKAYDKDTVTIVTEDDTERDVSEERYLSDPPGLRF